MGKIVDYNLTEEIAHGVYVSCLARDVARELGLSAHEVDLIALAGLLHDIGKLRLASYLYADEGMRSPLVVEEMKYVRMHSLLSSQTLEEFGFDDEVCRIIRYHHENNDGTGYPEGLIGTNIPIGARVIRVCDVYAALTSDRPYRHRFSEEDAIALMIEDIRCFDLRVFLAFERVVHRVGTSYKPEIPDSDEELCPAIAVRKKRPFVRYARWKPRCASGADGDTVISLPEDADSSLKLANEY